MANIIWFQLLLKPMKMTKLARSLKLVALDIMVEAVLFLKLKHAKLITSRIHGPVYILGFCNMLSALNNIQG